MEVTRYGLFADRGILMDLTSYIDADPLKDDLFDFAREVGVYQGKNYIVLFNNSTPVLPRGHAGRGQPRPLTQPLLRKRNGQYDKEGEFEPVSREEAFDVISQQAKRVLREKGPQAAAMFGSGQWTIWKDTPHRS